MSSPEFELDESMCDSDPHRPEDVPPAVESTSAAEERSESTCSSSHLPVVKSVESENSLTAADSTLKTIDTWPVLEILPGGVINNSHHDDDNFTRLVSIDMSEKPKINIPMYLDMVSHADIKLWSCAVCDDSFDTMRELSDHVKTHRRDDDKASKRKAPTPKKKPKGRQPKDKQSKKPKCEVAVAD